MLLWNCNAVNYNDRITAGISVKQIQYWFRFRFLYFTFKIRLIIKQARTVGTKDHYKAAGPLGGRRENRCSESLKMWDDAKQQHPGGGTCWCVTMGTQWVRASEGAPPVRLTLSGAQTEDDSTRRGFVVRISSGTGSPPAPGRAPGTRCAEDRRVLRACFPGKSAARRKVGGV